jgi:hypothetical protein
MIKGIIRNWRLIDGAIVGNVYAATCEDMTKMGVKSAGDLIRTSSVVAIDLLSDGSRIARTRNSRYLLLD